MLLFIISFVVMLCIIHYSMHLSWYGKMIDKIPGPPVMPVIGNGFLFMRSLVSCFTLMRKLADKYDGIYRLWMGHLLAVSIYNPEDCEIIMSNPKYASKDIPYPLFKPWLGDGLLTSNGDKWHQRRKMLTPTFHFNILRQFCDIFNDESVKFVKKLSPGVVEMHSHLSNFSLRVICETAMGINLDSIPKAESENYMKNIHDISELIVYRTSRIWLYYDWIFGLTAAGKRQKKVLSVLHNFTDAVISERASSGIVVDYGTDQNNKPNESERPKKRLAMLDLLFLCEAEGKIDKKGIREEVDTFMFEGHDTTTTALDCLMMELANNAEVQERIVEEIENVFGKDEEQMTMEKLNMLVYLDRCIKEGLRLYPSGAFIARHIKENTQLHKYVVPRYIACFIHIYDLHRRADLYPEPSKFDPDRFLPEVCAKRHPYAYIPFSAGPRNCIGQKFAMLEMKALLVSVLRKFKLEPVTRPHEVVFRADVVLRAASSVKIRLVARNDAEKL